jgi:predicted enzyme related to lactoylglutathione lyase
MSGLSSGFSSKFTWHDLVTSDVEGATRFYTELCGWQLVKEPKGPYTLILMGGKDVGGVLPLDEGLAKGGVPPHVMPYVSVQDLEATVAAVRQHGGRVMMPGMEIENVGRFAVIADPTGGVLAPFQSSHGERPETHEPPPPYGFCWDELMSPDPEAAAAFYGAVFGWRVERVEMPGFGSYWLLKRTGVKDEMGADRNAGGVMKLPPGVPQAAWITYLVAPDADATAEKVKALGGRVLMPPMDIPGVGRFFSAMDPQGAAISFLTPAAPAG